MKDMLGHLLSLHKAERLSGPWLYSAMTWADFSTTVGAAINKPPKQLFGRAGCL